MYFQKYIRERERERERLTSRVRKQNMEEFIKHFFSLISPLKKPDYSKFLLLALLFKHFFIRIQSDLSGREKKWQRIYDLLNIETKPKKKVPK